MNDTEDMKPKVSIVVPVYKVEAYIEQCVRSLFEQTLENLEFIFVDDASPDESVAIIKRVLDEYPQRKGQVKFIRHEHNMDISQTRKNGLNAATGEYFIYVDSDDWVEPNYAELLYNKAQETGAEVVICNFYNYYSEKEWVLVGTPPHGEGMKGEMLRDDTLNRQCSPNLWIRLVSRSLFDENDIAWPVCGMAEDLVLSSQFSYYAKSLAHVDVPLYHYRCTPNSYVKMKNEETVIMKRANGFIANLGVLEDFMRKKGINKKYEQGLFISKVFALAELNPIIDKPKYWWKYVSTYPSVNLALIFGNKYVHLKPIKRLRLLTIMLGIYPVGKRLKAIVAK